MPSLIAVSRLLAIGLIGVCFAAVALWRAPGDMDVAPAQSAAVVQPGQPLTVPAGGNLQAALNAARPGDVIEISAGARFVGNFTLPYKPGAGWIMIRSSAHDRLPPPGSRVSPAHADLMPKIVSPNSAPAISTASRAHHYRFIGIEITTTNAINYNLVLLESARQTSLDRVPSDIVFDRCYIHGTPTGDIRRGIALNGARLAVIDSHLSDFHERGADSQAIAGWNGPGPFRIINNYLEGAGENVMFGGAAPTIHNLVPSDIEIRRNHFVKPLTWKIGAPTYAGYPWTVKNLFELKNARRVIIDGNVFEHNWAHAQSGFAIVLTVRTERDAAPWAVVEDVTFVNNIVRHTASGINILGRDDSSAMGAGRTRRIAIKNNLFVDVGGAEWGGEGRLLQMLEGIGDVLIEHNTAFHTGAIIVADGAPHQGFVYRNNIAFHNQYGVFGSGQGSGMPALLHYFPGFVFQKNMVIGAPDPTRYPPNNYYPASVQAVGFADVAGGRYGLAGSSPYKGAATDGTDVGVDVDALLRAQPSAAR